MTAPHCGLALPPGVLAKLATKYPSAKWIISYQKLPWSKPDLHPLAENSSCSTGQLYNHMAWVKLLPSVQGQAGCHTEARPPWRPRSPGSPVPSQHLAASPRSQNFSPAQITQLGPILKTKGLLRSLGKTGLSHLSPCRDEQWDENSFSLEQQQQQRLCSRGLSVYVERGLLSCLYISWCQEICFTVA